MYMYVHNSVVEFFYKEYLLTYKNTNIQKYATKHRPHNMKFNKMDIIA